MNKSSFLFGLVYSVCLIFCIIDFPIMLAGFPLKYFFVIALLVMCVVYKSRETDWFMLLYLAFLFCFFVAGVVSGYGNETIMKLIGTYSIALILYKATTIMVKRFDNLNCISLVLLGVFLIDAIITIGQFYRDPFCMSIPTLLDIQMLEQKEAEFYESIDMEGVTSVGVVGAVANGYLLSVATILAWYPFNMKNVFLVNSNKEKSLILVNLAIWGVCMLSSFYTQERSGFYLAIVFSLYIFFLVFRNNTYFGRTLILFLIIAIFFSIDPILELVTTYGRYSIGMEAEDRQNLINLGFDFILQHPLGGVDLWRQQYPHMPHNLLINMYVAGGWLGGTILLSIVVYQMYKCGVLILKTDKKKNWLPLLFTLMYLNLTAESFVHNNSIVYGGTLFFVCWGVVSCYVSKEKLRKRGS